MEVSLPSYAEIERIIGRIRILAGKTHIEGTDHVRLNKMILWYSRQLLAKTDSIRLNHRQKIALHFLTL